MNTKKTKTKDKIVKTCKITAYLRQCIAILLIVFALLNMLFLAMGEITINTFWFGIMIIGGLTWIFYKNK